MVEVFFIYFFHKNLNYPNLKKDENPQSALGFSINLSYRKYIVFKPVFSGLASKIQISFSFASDQIEAVSEAVLLRD